MTEKIDYTLEGGEDINNNIMRIFAQDDKAILVSDFAMSMYRVLIYYCNGSVIKFSYGIDGRSYLSIYSEDLSEINSRKSKLEKLADCKFVEEIK